MTARSSRHKAASLLELPLEILTHVCQQLDVRSLARVDMTCTHFRHGDGRLEMLDLLTKWPVAMAVREHAFPGGDLSPIRRPRGYSESWAAYLTRCARQRRCLEAAPVVAGDEHSLFVECGRPADRERRG